MLIHVNFRQTLNPNLSVGEGGWPELIPRVGLNFQLKGRPKFSAEELALKFSRRVHLNLLGEGVGLNSFQELALIFS